MAHRFSTDWIFSIFLVILTLMMPLLVCLSSVTVSPFHVGDFFLWISFSVCLSVHILHIGFASFTVSLHTFLYFGITYHTRNQIINICWSKKTCCMQFSCFQLWILMDFAFHCITFVHVWWQHIERLKPCKWAVWYSDWWVFSLKLCVQILQCVSHVVSLAFLFLIIVSRFQFAVGMLLSSREKNSLTMEVTCPSPVRLLPAFIMVSLFCLGDSSCLSVQAKLHFAL